MIPTVVEGPYLVTYTVKQVFVSSTPLPYRHARSLGIEGPVYTKERNLTWNRGQKNRVGLSLFASENLLFGA